MCGCGGHCEEGYLDFSLQMDRDFTHCQKASESLLFIREIVSVVSVCCFHLNCSIATLFYWLILFVEIEVEFFFSDIGRGPFYRCNMIRHCLKNAYFSRAKPISTEHFPFYPFSRTSYIMLSKSQLSTHDSYRTEICVGVERSSNILARFSTNVRRH